MVIDSADSYAIFTTAGPRAWDLDLIVAADGQERVSGTPQAPPPAPVKPVTDDYHGITVSDRHRYMEKLDDAGVQTWFKGQDNCTRSVLATIPGRDRLLARIKELDQTVPQVGARRLPGVSGWRFSAVEATAGRLRSQSGS
jgi:prolyl oligopeptidase family protein